MAEDTKHPAVVNFMEELISYNETALQLVAQLGDNEYAERTVRQHIESVINAGKAIDRALTRALQKGSECETAREQLVTRVAEVEGRVRETEAKHVARNERLAKALEEARETAQRRHERIERLNEALADKTNEVKDVKAQLHDVREDMCDGSCEIELRKLRQENLRLTGDNADLKNAACPDSRAHEFAVEMDAEAGTVKFNEPDRSDVDDVVMPIESGGVKFVRETKHLSDHPPRGGEVKVLRMIRTTADDRRLKQRTKTADRLRVLRKKYDDTVSMAVTDEFNAGMMQAEVARLTKRNNELVADLRTARAQHQAAERAVEASQSVAGGGLEVIRDLRTQRNALYEAVVRHDEASTHLSSTMRYVKGKMDKE